jgi:hypothetical protein
MRLCQIQIQDKPKHQNDICRSIRRKIKRCSSRPMNCRPPVSLAFYSAAHNCFFSPKIIDHRICKMCRHDNTNLQHNRTRIVHSTVVCVWCLFRPIGSERQCASPDPSYLWRLVSLLFSDHLHLLSPSSSFSACRRLKCSVINTGDERRATYLPSPERRERHLAIRLMARPRRVGSHRRWQSNQ